MRKAMRKRATVVKLEPARRETAAIAGHKVGWLVGSDESGLLVDYPGNAAGPLSARILQALDSVSLQKAIETRQEALLAFDGERPIVVGLLAQNVSLEAREAVVDGRRVVLEGKDEIVLRCGEASITLRRNGRVVIRGAYVEARSKGVNRIRGGSVQIN
jgi:hypothetical protein